MRSSTVIERLRYRPRVSDPEAISAPELADRTPPPAPLTDPQIDVLIDRYKREMARYEKAGGLVADRLRRELRQAGVKHMVSSRPKHPQDLAEKLRKKARAKPAVYTLERLTNDLGAVVTDLAGCRVVVYSAADEDIVGAMIPRVFAMPDRPDAAVDRRRGVERPYWATHALVHPYGPGDAVDASVEGAICELQIVTVAAHLFNEIEHDITYKDRDAGLIADEAEKQVLVELRGVARVADRLVAQLLDIRASRRDELAVVIEDAETLRYTLSRQAGRPLKGTDLGRLLSLLEKCIDRVTPAAIRALGEVDDIIEKGRSRLSGGEDFDETVLYAVGLLDQFEDEIEATVRRWTGPRSPMRRAIELAILRSRTQTGGSNP